MPLFIYRCPVTGYPVQGFSAEDTSEDRHTYEPVTCLACRQIHHVNPATGAVLGEKVESASVTSVAAAAQSQPVLPRLTRRATTELGVTRRQFTPMPHGGDGERQVASDRSVTMAQGRYWIALFKKGGESAGVEHELARHDESDLARSIYRQMVANYPARLVMLCDRATVLARSDRSPAYTPMRRAG